MANTTAFFPCIGKKSDLSSLAIKNGQLIITVDDGKIYADVYDNRYLIGTANRIEKDITIEVTDWVGESAPYTYTISDSEITDNMIFISKLVISNAESANQELIDYNYIDSIESENGAITLYCYSNRPTITLNILLKQI